MAANQLPENMGKKIVEALKKQALYEDEYVAQLDDATIDLSENVQEVDSAQEQPVINEITEPVIQEQPQIQIQPIAPEISESALKFSMNAQPAPFNSYSPELPTNVAVLKKLILQLPAGVSKQVGAQIIRQTVEALGISMNSVLQEAQQVQEGLNNAITDCTLKMQEYKNQIMQLEGNTRDFQRQMSQINDLISLFILTDNKK